MSKRILWPLVLLAALLLLAPTQRVAAQPAAARQTSNLALVLSAEGPLTPIMIEYVERGIETAAQRQAALLILQLNTPGGSVDLMTAMVEAIRASETPIVVYVAPSGAIAGSAGTVITLAGHQAAMAPQTAIGAASPVGGEGEDIGETMEAKIKEIIKAQIRALAADRPPEAIAVAEDTVENAIALTASEALEVGLIDYIATDLSDLLRQLDGQVVTTASGEHILNTQYTQLEHLDITLIEELLAILTNPNIVFLLLTIGVQALLIELGSPGGWVAGFVGVVCLALAGYGLGILPVNWFGLILLLTAFVLFFLEIKAPTHGALSLTGLAAFIAGALVLFNSPGTPEFSQVSVPLVVTSGIITAASFIAILSFAIRAQMAPVRMGQSVLVGQVGIVKREVPPRGQGEVQLGGERWVAELAVGDQPLAVGEKAEVVVVQGLRLKVQPPQEKDT